MSHTIKPEHLLKGYPALAKALNVSIKTARQIVKASRITEHRATQRTIYFDYQEVYTKYILGRAK